MSSLQRELAVRKRVLDIFNKTQTQFDTDQEWFDYQELAEDHIYNLVEGTDVQKTEAAIEAYQKANYEDIVANDAKKRGRAHPRVTGTAAGNVVTESQATQSQPSGNLYAAEIRPPGLGQPQPVAPAGISSQPAPPVGQMTAEQHLRMALASGWNPDLAHQRSLQLAFYSF